MTSDLVLLTVLLDYSNDYLLVVQIVLIVPQT